MKPLALVRRPAPRLATEATLTFRPRQGIDGARAESQHADYVQALETVGFHVVELSPLPDHPDGTFVEDLGVALPEVMVWGRTGVPGRQGEVEDTLRGSADALTRLGLAPGAPGRPVHTVPAPARLEGGDVLVVGRTVLVGISGRTDRGGTDRLARVLEPYGYRVWPVPVTGALHLKTACAALAPGLLLANPRWVDLKGNLPGAFRVIPVPHVEPFGANVLPLESRVLVSASAPRTADRIAELELEPLPVDISAFERAEGGLTCLSLRVPPPVVETGKEPG